MPRTIGIILLLALSLSVHGSGPLFVPQRLLDQQTLQLLSQGEARFGLLLRVYDAALYGLPGSTTDQLLDAQASKCLSLAYRVSISREQLIEGAERILARQLPAGSLEAIRPELDRLHEHFVSVKPGDRYTLCGSAGRLTLYFNEEAAFEIGDPGLLTAYFGIWLEPEGISESLRKQLMDGLPPSTIPG